MFFQSALSRTGRLAADSSRAFCRVANACLLLAQPNHDADVHLGAGMMVAAGEQFRSRSIDALLGKIARLLEHAPAFKTTRNFEVFTRILRAAVDQRGLQRRDNFFGLSLAGANCRRLSPSTADLCRPVDKYVRSRRRLRRSASGVLPVRRGQYKRSARSGRIAIDLP